MKIMTHIVAGYPNIKECEKIAHTMADTGGSSKGREREPDFKPPRDDVKNRFKPKKVTEKDSDSEKDPDKRPD